MKQSESARRRASLGLISSLCSLSHTVSSSSITLAVVAILHADISASFIRHSNAALPDIDDEIGKLGAEAKLENFAINT